MNLSTKRFSITFHKVGWFDRFFALLFALLPIVQPIASPFPVTWSMFILILSVPYLAFIILKKHRLNFNSVWPISVYAFYKIFNHGTDTTEVLTMLYLIVLVIALVNRCISVESFNRYVINIMIIATFCVFLQYVAYYVFHNHIVFLSPLWLRTEEMQMSYFSKLSTGISGSLFRPSAFFIEPSTMSLYSLPSLFYCLFSRKANETTKKIAIIITIGVFLTTSGMGILYSIIIWCYYFLKKISSEGRFNFRWFLLSFFVLLFAILAGLSIPFIRDAVLRIFYITDGSNTAIMGRLGSGLFYFEQLSFNEKIFGAGKAVSDYSLYLSGIFAIIVDSGIVGYIAFCNIFGQLSMKVNNSYRLFAIMLIGISIISNIALIQMEVFFLIAVINGLYDNKIIRA